MVRTSWTFTSNRRHHIRIPIPTQKRILSAPCHGGLRICPVPQKVLLAAHPRQLPSDRAIHILHELEVGREEDVKIPLVHERCADLHVPPLIACLHNWSIEPGYRVRGREGIKVCDDEPVGGEVGRENVEELHEPRRKVFRDCQVGRERQ